MRKLLAGVVILVLTGCAQLPVGGPVRIGPDISTNSDNETFYYSPSSPDDGASQSEIVSGFIAAGTGPQNDYAVAREFLSESIRTSWNPSQEVLIQRASPKLTILDGDRAELELDLSARIDADGRYEALAPGTKKILEFSFSFENDQWRLNEAPDATVLIRPVFDVVFQRYSVYFVDRQKRFLVPELRWFPATAATGTRLANALLRGASEWLKPAVVSAIPSGTKLSIDAVTVENGVALVDLTARALVATRADRSLMKAQLDATLSQLPNVEQVAISIERSGQEIPESQGTAKVSGLRELVVLSENGLELVGSSDSGFLGAGKEFFEFSDISKIAITRESGWVAGLSRSGVIRTKAQDPGQIIELVDSRQGIAAVEFDRQQYLWTLARARGSEVFATFTTGVRTSVAAPWLANQSVRSFSISPEGSRAVYIVAGPDRNRVLLGAIVRNQSGTPIELATPIEIGTEGSSPSLISWVDEINVAVASAGEGNAYVMTVGGTSKSIPALAAASSLVAAGPSSQLYSLNNQGQLYSLRASTWSPELSGIFAITAIN